MFAQYGLKPTRGVLLVGPSGSGKTTLLRYRCLYVERNALALACSMF